MEHEKSDRMVVDEMVARLPAEDRADLEKADRDHRFRTTPLALQVNAGTRTMFSPSGELDDDAIAALEYRYESAIRRRGLR